MKPLKIVTPVSGDPDAPNQNLLGLGALAVVIVPWALLGWFIFAMTQ